MKVNFALKESSFQKIFFHESPEGLVRSHLSSGFVQLVANKAWRDVLQSEAWLLWSKLRRF